MQTKDIEGGDHGELRVHPEVWRLNSFMITAWIIGQSYDYMDRVKRASIFVLENNLGFVCIVFGFF